MLLYQRESSPPSKERMEKTNDSSSDPLSTETFFDITPKALTGAEQEHAANAPRQPPEQRSNKRDESGGRRGAALTPNCHDASSRGRRKSKSRRSLRYREPRSCGMVWRILLSASLLAAVVYAAVAPSAMRRNTALCVAVGVGASVAAAQLYIIVTRFLRCAPYSVWAVVALDGASVLGWCAAVAVLSYWHRAVLYRPGADADGEPAWWRRDCYDAPSGYAVYDAAAGAGTAVNVVWCDVEVDGRARLIGNAAARLQHRTVIGLSAVSLFFNAIVLYISVRKQRNPNWGSV
ncbi:hypothetical protein V2A60_008152 [Cordyceps javanica]